MTTTPATRPTGPRRGVDWTSSTGTGVQRCWTRMGARLGYTASRGQREQIVAATRTIRWTPPGAAHAAAVRQLAGPAGRAILNAVVGTDHDRSASAVRIGSALLDDRRLLVGLDNTHGLRVFLLDVGAEAVCVLAEFDCPRPVLRRQHGRGTRSRA